jgi:hypothetical protein
VLRALALATLASTALGSATQEPADAKARLDATRLELSKWIETQQLVAKERKDWQQGKEILVARVELLRKEVSGLEQKIRDAQANVDAANAKRDALLAENAALVATGAQLASSVSAMEGDVRRLIKSAPVPVAKRPAPLLDRMPADPATTKVAVAERFQNVLGVLNEFNKANTEINIEFEVHTLSDGRPSEVTAIYVGLAQAYYVGKDGQAAGIGRPTSDGWKWEPANQIAGDVLMALEILQGKHSPAFVPLPVTIQ